MKKVKLSISLCVTVFTLAYLFKPTMTEAKQAEFEYKYTAYIEWESKPFNICWHVVNECTTEAGSSCTIAGTKSRGLEYCILPF